MGISVLIFKAIMLHAETKIKCMYFPTRREVWPVNNTFKVVTCKRDAYRIRQQERLRTACESAQSGFSLLLFAHPLLGH